MPSFAFPPAARLLPTDGLARAAAALPSTLDWLARGRQERLVLFLPMLILPTVTAAHDLLLLGTLFLLVTIIEAALQPVRGRDRSALAVAAFGWLLAGLVLGTGAASILALFVLVRAIDQRLPEAFWPLRLGLAALATALLVDLALIALALERSSIWLALAAAIGCAIAAARQLAAHAAAPPPSPLAAVTTDPKVYLEAALIAAGCLVLAFYAALLALEPALGQLAATGRYLALPLLAAAVARLGWLALAPVSTPTGQRGPDPLAVLLLAGWALVGLALGGGASLT